jgi:RNA polymerase sigma factor (TIGR02999 family)
MQSPTPNSHEAPDGAAHAWFDDAYQELKRLAHAKLHGARSGEFSTTVLVHEAYLKMHNLPQFAAASRGEFLAYAARAMHSIIVDAARSRMAAKRAHDTVTVTSITELAGIAHSDEALLAFEGAMQRLQATNERLFQIVEMRFFAGMEVDDIAAAMGVSDRTVKRDFQAARAYLFDALDVAE